VLFQVITKKDAQLLELNKIEQVSDDDGTIPQQKE